MPKDVFLQLGRGVKFFAMEGVFEKSGVMGVVDDAFSVVLYEESDVKGIGMSGV